MRDSTVTLHRTVKNQGCPTRRGYAWGVLLYRRNRSGQRIKTANNQIKSPTRKPDAWATEFISSFGVRATRRGDYSLNLILQDSCIHVIVLRHSDKIPVQLRHKQSWFRRRPYRSCSQRPVMVSVSLFINIYCACIGFGIDAFRSGIKDHAVDALANWDAGDLLPRRRIEYHDDFAAATHKQAMGGFINRQPDRQFSKGEGPTGKDRALLGVNHLDAVLLPVYNEEPRARFLEPHFFHRPTFDPNIPEVRTLICIHDGDQRVIQFRVLSTGYDVEIVGSRVIQNAIGLGELFHSLDELVFIRFENLQRSGGPISDKDLVQIPAIKHSVCFLNTRNTVNQLARLQVVDL